MSDPITAIRNLGPAMADAFARAGITTATQLRALGTDAAYAALLAGGTRAHFIPYYCIEMGLQGRPWNDCKGAEKDRLRVRFDAIVAHRKEHAAQQNAASNTDPAFEAALDALGVIPALKLRSDQPTSSSPAKK
ncbi:TfoX/Sxy family DNA transformation protein [Roseicitreum antarcticum]|uniref:TfoX C-terminal domain-containing protein n=1 Tax=Roseicitreum antarcticum TaxID=564137 RepID=A0A1H2XTY6_9RHOB|nr:TfoX/Sxy family DNA transformation protein [Roseicitreum antarcticum]SDW96422.1 TfoX C-terminal domain-containing protein [Roseicitreum antarcticum]